MKTRPNPLYKGGMSGRRPRSGPEWAFWFVMVPGGVVLVSITKGLVAGAIVAVIAALVTIYVWRKIEQSDASADRPALTNELESDPDMGKRSKLILVSGDGLQTLREARRTGVSMTDALGAASSGGATAVPYEHSTHYLAFVMAYLRDEGKLPDRDWALGDAFYEERRRITDVMPSAGIALDALRVENYDLLELRREFHAGGPLTDPAAAEALRDALLVLRENLEQTGGEGALIVAY